MTTPNLDKINPKLHEGYSPNLYRWLKKNHSRYEQYGVWYRAEDDQRFVGFIHGPPFEKDFIGMRLNSILCRVRGIGNPCCYIGLASELVEDVDFWPLYERIGRCAIDPEHKTHFMNAENRFTGEHDIRKCNWCGQVQLLHKWEEVIPRERWENLV